MIERLKCAEIERLRRRQLRGRSAESTNFWHLASAATAERRRLILLSRRVAAPGSGADQL